MLSWVGERVVGHARPLFFGEGWVNGGGTNSKASDSAVLNLICVNIACRLTKKLWLVFINHDRNSTNWVSLTLKAGVVLKMLRLATFKRLVLIRGEINWKPSYGEPCACHDDAWCWFTVSLCVTIAKDQIVQWRWVVKRVFTCFVAQKCCALWFSSCEAHFCRCATCLDALDCVRCLGKLKLALESQSVHFCEPNWVGWKTQPLLWPWMKGPSNHYLVWAKSFSNERKLWLRCYDLDRRGLRTRFSSYKGPRKKENDGKAIVNMIERA